MLRHKEEASAKTFQDRTANKEQASLSVDTPHLQIATQSKPKQSKALAWEMCGEKRASNEDGRDCIVG
jgi:hypothetical protein